MRSLRLARVAAEAEGLRLRYAAQRTVTRAVLGMIAFALFLGALIFFHIALWYWLRRTFDRPPTALIIGGAELVLAAILGLIAAKSSPGRIEAEALQIRRRALENASSGMAVSALATQLVPLAIRLMRRR